MELVLFALYGKRVKAIPLLSIKRQEVLQITPIYIREVNNRFKSDFKPSDAFSFQKSVLIWKMFQDAHNPSKHPKKLSYFIIQSKRRYFNEVWDKYRMLKILHGKIYEKVKIMNIKSNTSTRASRCSSESI